MSVLKKAPHSMFWKPRTEELEIRLPSDPIGKQLIEEMRANPTVDSEFREKYLPEIPGYKAEKLVNRYQQERFLNTLIGFKVRQHLLLDSAPKAVLAAALNAVIKPITTFWDKGIIENVTEAISMPKNVLTNVSDALMDVNKRQIDMGYEYKKKKLEYILLTSQIERAERRDWLSFIEGEQDRAYMSQNRNEWFFLGNSLAGVHQSVTRSIEEMELSYSSGLGGIEGTTIRREYDLIFGFVDRVSRYLPSNNLTKRKDT